MDHLRVLTARFLKLTKKEARLKWWLICLAETRRLKLIHCKLKQPLASDLIKKAAGVEKGSGVPNKTKVGKITKDQLKEIAERKMPDLNTENIDAAMKTMAGTAKNMGIEIVE